MPRMIYENRYKCPRCGLEWSDEWCAMCDDRCPACDLESSPLASFYTGFECEHPDCLPDVPMGA